MGRKRPWVIFGQLGLIISFLSIGFVNDPLNNLNHLMIVGFCISFFGAFQDVATDGRQRVADGALVPMLVKAIQELSAEIEILKAK